MNKHLKSKKLIFNKAFQPLPVNEGDELFKNGIFDFNITQLLTSIRSDANLYRQEEVEVSSLRSCPSNLLDESTISKADPSRPIILAEISPGRFNVIDGNHRLEKAHRDNMKTIPAYKLEVYQHIAFLTSVKAYETYVSYWNSKIDNC